MKELSSAQVSTVIADPHSVDDAILSRFSTRAYSDKPVDKAVLTDLLQVAARAPSGTNTQPWKVYVVQGAAKDKLITEVCDAHNAMAANPALAADFAEAYDYYPTQWVSPYIDRRRECGFGLVWRSWNWQGRQGKNALSAPTKFSVSLVRRWAYFLPSTKSWAAVVCSITACSSKVSCWLLERADCTHAHRPHGIVLEKLFSNTLARATTK
jgi:hypothetical protein